MLLFPKLLQLISISLVFLLFQACTSSTEQVSYKTKRGHKVSLNATTLAADTEFAAMHIEGFLNNYENGSIDKLVTFHREDLSERYPQLRLMSTQEVTELFLEAGNIVYDKFMSMPSLPALTVAGNRAKSKQECKACWQKASINNSQTFAFINSACPWWEQQL